MHITTNTRCENIFQIYKVNRNENLYNGMKQSITNLDITNVTNNHNLKMVIFYVG